MKKHPARIIAALLLTAAITFSAISFTGCASAKTTPTAAPAPKPQPVRVAATPAPAPVPEAPADPPPAPSPAPTLVPPPEPEPFEPETSVYRLMEDGKFHDVTVTRIE